MKKLSIFLLLFCLYACHNAKSLDKKVEKVICDKQSEANDKIAIDVSANYIVSFIVGDGILNRKILVNEYMEKDFESIEQYEKYMNSLLEIYLLKQDDSLSIKPYYEKDKIVYPHTIYDYTDLSHYSEKEIPMEVRTKDGKAIDFDLYWEYINKIGMLDGFTCALQKDE